jgi:hypothetical protein
MGILTDANSRPLLYDHTKDNYTIREGIIVAKNKKVFDVCKDRIETTLKRSIPSIHKEIAEEARKAREKRGVELPSQHKVIKLDPTSFDQNNFPTNNRAFSSTSTNSNNNLSSEEKERFGHPQTITFL